RDTEREHSIVQAMNEHRIDGLIICSTSFSPQQSSRISEYGIPIVVINNQSAEDYRYSIYHDDVDGSRKLTRHLIDLGHRRVAYLGNLQSGRSTQDRLRGFQQEMRAAGLDVPDNFIHQVEGGLPESGLQGLQHFLRLPVRPTAIVCYNDMMAFGVLKGLRLAGLRVPEDISVTGFDNIVFSAYTNPLLTTFDQPKRSIGNQAAGLVLELLEQEHPTSADVQPKVILLPGRLLERESTAPPNRTS
ncbi:MAG: substrate-binding domain-containing protein, partial [Anaerolineaceae bacterium]